MQDNLYEIFGLTSFATNDEIDEAYKRLRDKYRRDMFLSGEEGENAAQKLTELENAYNDILESRSYFTPEETASENGAKFKRVEELVKAGKINEAQDILDNITERTADWHYYQAMVFYKKDWFTDSKKQLELALSLDKNNAKYKKALDRLEKLMAGGSKKAERVDKNSSEKRNAAEEWWREHQKRTDDEAPDWDDNNRQMGGCDDALNCCTQLLCLNLFCNCIGGGC